MKNINRRRGRENSIKHPKPVSVEAYTTFFSKPDKRNKLKVEKVEVVGIYWEKYAKVRVKHVGECSCDICYLYKDRGLRIKWGYDLHKVFPDND